MHTPDEGAWAPCCVVVPFVVEPDCVPDAPDCELDDPDWAAFGCEPMPLPWPARWLGLLWRVAVRVILGIPLEPLPCWLAWNWRSGYKPLPSVYGPFGSGWGLPSRSWPMSFTTWCMTS